MSNCIELYNTAQATNKVVFLRDEIDVTGFKAFVGRAKELDRSKQKPGMSSDVFTEEELSLDMAWWFLQTNSVVDSRGAVIRFGEGRSTHTWRDFQGILGILSHFMKKQKWHRFVATDESDGHRKPFWLDVEFKRATIGGKTREERDAEAKAYVDSLNIDYSKIKVRTLTKDGWVEG